MSSSSESEDENLKQILEAADTTLLTDSLFNVNENNVEETVIELPKSQRYLDKEDDDKGIDFVPTETAQKLMSRRLTTLVEQLVEFVKPDDTSLNNVRKKKTKNRVKLLQGFDCYVKTYEEFEYDDIGPQVKPVIKRRNIDPEPDEMEKLACATMDGEYILSTTETKYWTERRKGKVFQYKGSGKVHHLLEEDNEFSKTRRKNKWNEAKIRSARFPKNHT